MNLISKRIRGMQDLLPEQSQKWQAAQKVMKDEARLCGFKLIRTPVLEHTELFERSVGDTSDIVEKEMYTFADKGGRSLSLRPEGTAGALRAVLENGLHNSVLPLKLMYFSSCYRYEKPQSGRYREFFQFGLEIFGSDSALADCELICAAKSIIDRLGIKNVNLEINSIGCQECRADYTRALKEYFESNVSNLCSTCNDRLKRNPMRIFDCKDKQCAEICQKAPTITDFICASCKERFESLKDYLDCLEVKYTVNPRIVRGLDYYGGTVFEFVCDDAGAPITVCGGGRYDGLSEIISGAQLSAIGFGMGIERIIMVMENQGIEFPKPEIPEVYIASVGEKARRLSIRLIQTLRKCGIVAETDISEKNLKPQMKYADKIGARYSLVIGDNEIESNIADIKNMENGKKFKISLGENFIKDFISVQTSEQ